MPFPTALRIRSALGSVETVSCLNGGILVRTLFCSHIVIIEATHPEIYIRDKRNQKFGRKDLIWQPHFMRFQTYWSNEGGVLLNKKGEKMTHRSMKE